MKGMKKILLGTVLLFCATVFFAQTKQIDASMIQGELVLPSTPTVTGYPSFNCCAQPAAAQTGA